MNRSAITMIVRVAALGSAGFAVLQTPAFSEPPAAFTTSQSNQSEALPALPSDPWQVNQLMKPEELVKVLSKSVGEKPLVFCVGYPVLYQGGHIAGSEFAGPTSKPDGLQKLKQEAESLPRDKQIVLYCGCCPWKDCPNIRPAFRAMQELGFKNVKVLDLPKNLREDWIDKGFPIQKADDAK
jgi:thiosulfate/3-mercaptopyruvate sulfurtransferase